MASVNKEVERLLLAVKATDLASIIPSTVAVVAAAKSQLDGLSDGERNEVVALLGDLVARAKAYVAGNGGVILASQLVETASDIYRRTGLLGGGGGGAGGVVVAAAPPPALRKMASTDAVVIRLLVALNDAVACTRSSTGTPDALMRAVTQAASAAKELTAEKDSGGSLLIERLGFQSLIVMSLTAFVNAAKGSISQCVDGKFGVSGAQNVLTSASSLSRAAKEALAAHASELGPGCWDCGVCKSPMDDDSMCCVGGCSRFFHRRCVMLSRGAFECCEWFCDLPPCRAAALKREKDERERDEKRRQVIEAKTKADEEQRQRRLAEEKALKEKQAREDEARRKRELEERLERESRERQLKETEERAKIDIERHNEDSYERTKREIALEFEAEKRIEQELARKRQMQADSVTTEVAANGERVRKIAPLPADDGVVCLARALFDYEVVGGSDDDLLFFEGDVIAIRARDADGWWTGEFNGRRGQFPSSFVRQLEAGESTECVKKTLAIPTAAAKAAPVSPTPAQRQSTAAPSSPTHTAFKESPSAKRTSFGHKPASSAGGSVGSFLDSKSSPKPSRPSSEAAKPGDFDAAKKSMHMRTKSSDGLLGPKVRLDKSMISLPKQDSFEHVSHLGFDVDKGGFDARGLPQDWLTKLDGQSKAAGSPGGAPGTSPAPRSPLPRGGPPPPPVAAHGQPSQSQRPPPAALPPTRAAPPPPSGGHVPPPTRAAPPPPPGAQPVPQQQHSAGQPVASSVPNNRISDGGVSSLGGAMASPQTIRKAAPPPPPEDEEARRLKVEQKRRQMMLEEQGGAVPPPSHPPPPAPATHTRAVAPTPAPTSAPEVEAIPVLPPPRKPLPRYRALYDFAADRDDELSLIAGDYVRVEAVGQDGWLKGLCERTGKTGHFPGNYVVEVLF
eukprot:Opistho-2@84203